MTPNKRPTEHVFPEVQSEINEVSTVIRGESAQSSETTKAMKHLEATRRVMRRSPTGRVSLDVSADVDTGGWGPHEKPWVDR